MMDKNYKQFVDKLNGYISKYYLYQLIRGLILFLFVFVTYYSLISGLEYLNYFEPKVKLFILLFTFLLTFFIFLYFVLIPIVKLLGLFKPITFYDVSAQLSKSYPEIKDKLINIIELANEESQNYSYELKKASIDQKINELKLFRFSDAIRFKDLKVIFGTFMLVAVIFSFAFIKSPEFYTESTVRLIHFQQKFEKPAPFSFVLQNKSMEIISGESMQLKLRCEGKEIPMAVYVNIGGNNFMMENKDDLFSYVIENMNSSITVYFTDKKYVSKTFRITVLNKPFISSFTVETTPPVYTNLPSETFQNIGDLKIPSGTKVKWLFKAADTDSLTLLFNDSTKVSAKKTADGFEVSKIIVHEAEYKVALSNSRLTNDGNLVYKIQTISDLYPEIKVVQIRDSSDFKIFHFKGNIVDDYGFHSLNFHINAGEKDSVIQIPFAPFLLNQDFYYSFNFESVKNLGKSFKYYFSVRDNDFFNRYKRTICETFTFSFPDYLDLVSKENSDMNSIDKLFDKSSKLTEAIQKQVNELKQKQIDSQLSEYDKFQMVKDIMNKKNDLENILDQIKQKNKDASNFTNSFTEENSEILNKQKQIEELLKEVFSDELKKLFEEFNELAKQFDQRKFEQLSKQMDTGLDDLAKQLDKNMQLLKRMKVEQKVERIIDELKKLSADERTNLGKLEKRSDLKEINTLEDKNSELLQNLENDYKNTVEFNSTLEKPLNLFNFDKEFSVIKDSYSKIKEDSSKGNKRKTSSEMDKNGQAIDQLVFAMNQMITNGKEKENQENIDNLKQILDNLIFVSFDQERLLNQTAQIDYNNPLVKQLKLKQKNLISQVVFIKDSLYALSKRAPEIGAIISKEMLSLESNTSASFDNLESGNIGGARMYQQYGITAANNLALFLSESLENLKKQQNGSGDGDCDKPGGKGSKPGMMQLKESQNSIKEQLQQMIDQMKKGEMGKLSKSIGQTIAQQEIMQQLIQDMVNGSSVGSSAKQQLKAVDQMLEQSRKDLINRNISSELINRQNMILSKLLDAEKSEIERGQDDKRESKTAGDIKGRNPEGYFEYKNKHKVENELAKPTDFRLRNFYDQKYNSFLNKINE